MSLDRNQCFWNIIVAIEKRRKYKKTGPKITEKARFKKDSKDYCNDPYLNKAR
jgi:hypothetical protein